MPEPREASSAATVDERPEYVSQAELDNAADTFVKAMGWRNQENLSKNLNLVVPDSDALKALKRALVRNFNIYRQEQIRRENEARRG